MEIENIEPKVAPEIKKEIDRMYNVYFSKTSRTNIANWLIRFMNKNNIKDTVDNIKNYIKFHRIGIPDYIFWQNETTMYYDISMDNDDE